MRILFKRRHWVVFGVLFACNLFGVIITFWHRGMGGVLAVPPIVLVLLVLAYLIALPFVTAILIVNLLQNVFKRQQRR